MVTSVSCHECCLKCTAALTPSSLILSDTFDVSALRFWLVTSLFIVFLLLHAPPRPGPPNKIEHELGPAFNRLSTHFEHTAAIYSTFNSERELG